MSKQIEHEQNLLRIFQIIGDRKRGLKPIIPVSRSTWLNGVKEKKFPQPVRLGKIVMWRQSDIQKVVDKLAR